MVSELSWSVLSGPVQMTLLYRRSSLVSASTFEVRSLEYLVMLKFALLQCLRFRHSLVYGKECT